ncbi:Ku protein [Amycolatopsis antarctica]|uniref:Non-homologous end joining protein Ku n=1 Tax=Amycolatopsis antarctica TaxID=1854586 RepID=A0A263CXR7_9PSEU|nr:Ku protein [Amycolatopsis antarctica]OZM70944.1 Ku protein [Amycolatopsis antarctica]
MRAMWKGAVSFGLVTIPIHLYAATENKNVTLRQVHAEDGGRIQYKRICSIDGEEVAYADVAKGYETESGEMVVLTNDDFADLPLSSSHVIDVLEFVPLESIDPIYFDRTYYLEPQKSAAKPYVLLRDALHKSSHVAVAKVALRQRETMALLRVRGDVLVMTTVLWPDEVRTPDFPFLQEEIPQVRPQELTMAGSLIDSLSDTVYEPEKYHDTYRQALESLIDSKVAGSETTAPAPVKDGKAEAVDLMDALRASVSAAKKTRSGEDGAETGKSTSKSGKSAKAGGKPAKAASGPKAKDEARSEAKGATKARPKRAKADAGSDDE